MGLEDLIARKQQRAKLKKKVIHISELEKIAAEEVRNRNEELTSRLGVPPEKSSWITKKKDEAADWSSDIEEEVNPFDSVKKVEEKPIEVKTNEETEPSYESKVWGSAKQPVGEVVNEKLSNEPGAFVPSALKVVSGVRPKLEDAMEFPSLEAAAKEDTIKPKLVVESDSNWKTAGRQEDSYYDGGYRNRNYDEGGFGGSRNRRRDQPLEENGDWSRGKVVVSSHATPDSGARRERSFGQVQDTPGSFVRGTAIKNPDSGRAYRPEATRSYASPDEGSWTRGNVINAPSHATRSQTGFERRVETKANDIQLRHKNQFDALSEMN